MNRRSRILGARDEAIPRERALSALLRRLAANGRLRAREPLHLAPAPPSRDCAIGQRTLAPGARAALEEHRGSRGGGAPIAGVRPECLPPRSTTTHRWRAP